MSKQDDPQAQQRMQAARQYMNALERGDLVVVAAILGEAEHDPILESLLLKVNRLYQLQEGIAVYGDELLQARRFLSVLREGAHIGTSDEGLYNSNTPPITVVGKNGPIHERRLRPMQLKTPPTPTNSIQPRKTAPRSEQRFPRAAHLAQVAAAVLVVGVLIAGFLLVYALRYGALRQMTQLGGQPASPTGIYISRSDGVYRLNIQTRKVIWHTHVAGQSLFAGDPVVIGDTVYIITDGPVSALDAQTGALRWSYNFHGRVTDPYVDDGLLYFSTLFPLSNALYAVNPATGTITATYTPKQGEWNSPVVVDGVLYYTVVSAGSVNSTLYAVQLPGEKLLWQKQLGNVGLFGPDSISVQNGIVYVKVGHDGPIDAFDAHTGSKLWQSPPIANGVRIVAITDTMIYAASFGGELLAFDAHTHALIWHEPFNTYDILVASGRLYIDYGPDIGQLAALNAATGKLLWQQSKSNGLGLVGVFNGVVYGENWPNNGKDGTIYAFSASNGSQLWAMSTGVPNVQWGGMVAA
jgi:outer membrane protein assembly factor BamB